MITIVTVVFVGIPNLVSLIVILWIAGGLPVEQNKLKDAFGKIAHSSRGFVLLLVFAHRVLTVLTRKILHYSPSEFGPSEQIDILRQKAKIDDILEHLQDIFSLPSFFVIITNIFMCSSILGKIMTGILSKILIVTVVFYGLSNLVSLTVLLWIAGGLPTDQNKLKDAFYKRAHSRFLIILSPEELPFKREILDKTAFVLNGCNILYYTRNSIFTLTGMLLTYAFIIYPN
ncbi:uncharacterized protein TNCT_716411 [Trichonephila clavata]|uniref:Uncharacterized protein n=1 Tax=Trichonephila clavata TaxID=2740835 RepID=A0A8X6LMD2_TRICU|nr:uncharacterized protein TNCT_716411 [Trichonephila clavata]